MDLADNSDQVVDVTTDDESAYAPINHRASTLASKIRRLNNKRGNLQAIEARLAKLDMQLQREYERTTITTTVDDILKCPICQEIMFDPYILQECGHTYCCKCLRNWFHSQKHDFVPDDMEEQNRPGLLYAMILNLEETLPELTTKGLSIALHPSSFAKPIFACPACRTAAPLCPTKNIAVREIALALHGPRPNDYPVIPQPWNELFPCILDVPSSAI